MDIPNDKVYTPPTAAEARALLKNWELSGSKASKLVNHKNGRQMRAYQGGSSIMPYAILFTLAMKMEGIVISIDSWREDLGNSE